MSARALAVAVFVCSCANAGNPGTGDDAPKIDAAVHHDASFQQADAPRPIDAGVDAPPVMIDAMPDAVNGSGLFCASNSDCTNAGECCFNFLGQSSSGLCTTGTIVLGACVPM